MISIYRCAIYVAKYLGSWAIFCAKALVRSIEYTILLILKSIHRNYIYKENNKSFKSAFLKSIVDQSLIYLFLISRVV